MKISYLNQCVKFQGTQLINNYHKKVDLYHRHNL